MAESVVVIRDDDNGDGHDQLQGPAMSKMLAASATPMYMIFSFFQWLPFGGRGWFVWVFVFFHIYGNTVFAGTSKVNLAMSRRCPPMYVVNGLA